MKCPHCNDSFHEAWQGGGTVNVQDPHSHHWDLQYLTCPECLRLVVRLIRWDQNPHGAVVAVDEPIIFPQHRIRPIPQEVTGEFRQDFSEACAVLDLSPKASAALSRRLLQHILRERAGVKEKTLEKEIEKVVEQGHLPTDLAEDLDALRQVGNFAAHPIKSEESGAVVEVAPGEAGWLLDLVEELLDYYFVRPAIRERKREELNEKLSTAGKPGLKTQAKDESA
jgi:hypothetical protein